MADRPLLHDPAVPAEHLLGPGAAEVIGSVLSQAGATLERSRPTGTTYHRGRSLTVAHEARVRWDDGRRTTETVVLAAGKTPPERSLVVTDGEHDIVVWRVPADPWLPGLAPALDPAAVGEVLAGMGLPSEGLRCRRRAYRPGRRAVVEVTGPGVRVFLKVVRPPTAEALHRRHRLLAPVVPVPASMGWSPEHGIVVLQGLPGRLLRDLLRTTGPLPRPGDVLGLLDALPDPGDDDAGVDWRSAEFAEHVGAVVPELAARTAALADGLAPFEMAAATTPAVPVHGDLYEAQLLVDGGRIVGLLDVDTFRTGRRVDDLATYVGHLAVLSTTAPAQRSRIDAHARRLLDGFDRVVDPALLRAGVAAVVLGLATGSFRVLDDGWATHTEHRVALAEAWLASAHDARAGPG